ncbi:MAG: choice-of-anchor D domain-containing protein [Pseudomonadota bacterium]
MNPLLLCLALASCRFAREADPGDIEPSGSPHILLDPLGLDFGPVAVDDREEHVLIATIGNDGDGDLHIQNIELEDSSAPFSITGVQSVLVQPGGTTQFEVVYDPTTAMVDSTYILIDTDDPHTPVASLFVGGEGLAPVLVVEPSSLDFGEVLVGCGATASIAMRNIGNQDLTLTGATLATTSGAFTLAGLPELPLTLAPAEGQELEVSFQPLSARPDQAVLTLTSDDPFNPEVSLAIGGVGQAGATVTEVFPERGYQPTDILIAVDTLGTMIPRLTEVQAQLMDFVDAALALGGDFHIGVVVGDNGDICGEASWIDASFSYDEALQALTDMLDPCYPDRHHADAALTLLQVTLNGTPRGGYNEGLLREGGRLELVGIGDGPDNSADTWAYYEASYQAYVDDPADLSVSGVGGAVPDGCDSVGPYTGVWEASAASHGLFVSLCDADWGEQLAPLAITWGMPLGRYPLSQAPAPASVVVTADSVPITGPWAWDARDGSLVIDPDGLPTPGSEVQITYTPADACTEQALRGRAPSEAGIEAQTGIVAIAPGVAAAPAESPEVTAEPVTIDATGTRAGQRAARR